VTELEKKMNTNEMAAKKLDTKILLSTLWIVVMINMLKADILSLYIPGAADEVAKTAGETPITQLMLGGAIMMEIAIVMIILSRVLKYRVNRWVNVITSIITIAFVVGGGVSYPHYIFIATVEVVCLLLIIWNAWKWADEQGGVSLQTVDTE
jgi:peptidoglycan biosynthesis protein MviN/MurJ (putative lipid II flippase)